MERRFLTIEDLQADRKTVFLRVDINVPIDPSTNQILDDTRIKSTKETLDHLKRSRVVMGSHQSRPGKGDFTSLEGHSKRLQRYCSQEVRFVEDVIGTEARKAIRQLHEGEILMLDNLRFCSEENIEDSPEKLAKTHMVQRLAPYFDIFVNDAFAAAHRSQPSLVAFAHLMPSAAGKLMEKELKALWSLFESPERPCVYLLGGSKVEDKLPVMEHILEQKKVDKILLGGLVGKFFLYAQGVKLNEADAKQCAEHLSCLDRAKRIAEKWGRFVEVPSDLAFLGKGSVRVDSNLSETKRDVESLDIGRSTISRYVKSIQDSRTVVANGPLGVFEQNGFDTGTRSVLEAIAQNKGFTVVGGGHLVGYASILGLESKFTHSSTAGGAMLVFLAGQELPAIKVLMDAAKRRALRS